VLVNREVGAGSGSKLEIPTEDGRSVRHVNLDQPNLFAMPMPEHGVALGGPHVAHPTGVGTEHRNQVPLIVVVSDDHGERDHAT
jgi:hypothetical protein